MKFSDGLIGFFLILCLISCDFKKTANPSELDSNSFDSDTIYYSKDAIPTNTLGDNSNEFEMDSLLRQWTWGDKIKRPLKSSITNFKYPSTLILNTWTFGDHYENLPVFTFQKDSINFHGEGKYIYSINFDSFRIFTNYDHPGDGITRGIITKLTKDSLKIKWSTDDIDSYVSINKKKQK